MVNRIDGLWRVTLSNSHQPYNYCLLERGFPTVDYITVVVVDAKKLMQCFRRCSLAIPSADKWEPKKRESIREFLDPRAGPREMPYIGFELREKKRFFGLLKSRQLGVVTFTNGRHRARYLQSAGADCFPVEVGIKDAALLEIYCGCSRPS